MKVLLTGGSGFIGKHCLAYLLQHGFVHLKLARALTDKLTVILS
jgi:nucleoside-diphosphate-sugar epimerase